MHRLSKDEVTLTYIKVKVYKSGKTTKNQQQCQVEDTHNTASCYPNTLYGHSLSTCSGHFMDISYNTT